MKIYIISVIIIFVLFIPVSFADAEIVNFQKASDGSSVYVFVQIIQRDSDGNLVGYLQSDKMSFINPDIINFYMNTKDMVQTISYSDANDTQVQIYAEKYTVLRERSDITASTLFLVSHQTSKSSEPLTTVAARFPHEGLVISPGDSIVTIWNFAKLLS